MMEQDGWSLARTRGIVGKTAEGNASLPRDCDYGRFRLSFARLEAQYENYQHMPGGRPRLDQEAVMESVSRRFGVCYDCLWKVLRCHMALRLGLPDVPNSPKPIFLLAAESYLLCSPVDQWLLYADRRIDNSHDYDGEKAKACLDVVPEFLADAADLYETMNAGAWT